LHALLKAQKILAIPDSAGLIYKSGAGRQPWRRYIDATETLRQWDAKFSTGEVFRHASEICEQWLVPEGERLEGMRAFWAAHRLTGDNSKERPYANIYPHLTTQSNTFEVHYMAQAITKSPDSPPDGFDPQLDNVGPIVRGHALIHRRIDPARSDIPDFAGVLSGGGIIPPESTLDNFQEILVARPELAAPEIIEVRQEIDSIRLRWRSRIGQLCALERSVDLTQWTTAEQLIAGQPSRNFTPPGGTAAPGPDENEIAFPIGNGSGNVFLRVRAIDPPS
jgi:hypothetical protein